MKYAVRISEALSEDLVSLERYIKMHAGCQTVSNIVVERAFDVLGPPEGWPADQPFPAEAWIARAGIDGVSLDDGPAVT